jgi:hypothetical protein
MTHIMKHIIISLSALLLFCTASLAAGKPHPHKAIDQPAPSARAGCLDNSRFFSHTAYVPAASEQTPRCGHLLSTDTLLAVRHWNRT